MTSSLWVTCCCIFCVEACHGRVWRPTPSRNVIRRLAMPSVTHQLKYSVLDIQVVQTTSSMREQSNLHFRLTVLIETAFICKCQVILLYLDAKFRMSNTPGDPGNLLEISKISWKCSGWLKILVLQSVLVKTSCSKTGLIDIGAVNPR